MKITVVGTGYVGLVTGACLADVGNDVLCLDLDERKLAVLKKGEVPFHEPGLAEIVRRNYEAGRLQFTSDTEAATRHATIQFIAVGTPPAEDGSADMQYVLAAAKQIARSMDGYRLIVDKSTVPVGTADRVHALVGEELKARGVDYKYSVVSNPEFLREGAAVGDFQKPARIIIGTDDAEAIEILRQLYAPFERNHPKIMVMDARTAELTKYAANAMLAARISFMNEMSLFAEAAGADIDALRRGIGVDERIGTQFLYAGCGYGGSCFPKDVKALLQMAKDLKVPASLLQSVSTVNDNQKKLLVEKIVKRFGDDLSGLTFAIWGLAFKPETDDVREAPSLVIIEELLRRGAKIKAFDPVAAKEAMRALGDPAGVSITPRAFDALEGADALVIVTEWKEFQSPDFDRMRGLLRQPVIFDGRNTLDIKAARGAGFEYSGIGRP